MAIARIANGGIAEVRDLALSDVPAHKRAAWLPIEGSPPEYMPEIETVIGPVTVVEKTRVLRKWTVEPLPIEAQRLSVKSEARRRILERFPEWKQSNMTARGVELQDLWRRNGGWTAQEQGEADALMAAWAWIKAVREASDTIEALPAVPRDFNADARWPA